jgi:hypothetical protein
MVPKLSTPASTMRFTSSTSPTSARTLIASLPLCLMASTAALAAASSLM